jgi:hypothetical protein
MFAPRQNFRRQDIRALGRSLNLDDGLKIAARLRRQQAPLYERVRHENSVHAPFLNISLVLAFLFQRPAAEVGPESRIFFYGPPDKPTAENFCCPMLMVALGRDGPGPPLEKDSETFVLFVLDPSAARDPPRRSGRR